jgi:hypothetical protein
MRAPTSDSEHYCPELEIRRRYAVMFSKIWSAVLEHTNDRGF